MGIERPLEDPAQKRRYRVRRDTATPIFACDPLAHLALRSGSKAQHVARDPLANENRPRDDRFIAHDPRAMRLERLAIPYCDRRDPMCLRILLMREEQRDVRSEQLREG